MAGRQPEYDYYKAATQHASTLKDQYEAQNRANTAAERANRMNGNFDLDQAHSNIDNEYNMRQQAGGAFSQ